MKHKRLKNYLKLGILLLGIPLIIYSCQKDDDFKDVEQQIAKSNHKIKATILNGNVVLKQNTLLKKQIKKITSPKKEFFENTIHSNSYGFSIDTSRIQIIETDFYKSYTFLNKTSGLTMVFISSTLPLVSSIKNVSCSNSSPMNRRYGLSRYSKPASSIRFFKLLNSSSDK